MSEAVCLRRRTQMKDHRSLDGRSDWLNHDNFQWNREWQTTCPPGQASFGIEWSWWNISTLHGKYTRREYYTNFWRKFYEILLRFVVQIRVKKGLIWYPPKVNFVDGEFLLQCSDEITMSCCKYSADYAIFLYLLNQFFWQWQHGSTLQ